VKILHVLDHSIPLQSGYTFRTRAILREQQRRGWDVVAVTSGKHGSTGGDPEVVDGLRFYRTPRVPGWLDTLPAGDQVAIVRDLARNLERIVAKERPDILHAHSPSLNALAALRVARSPRLPVVYEIRGFWEDAAADHGTTREGSLRYRATRALETWAVRRADAIAVICEGLRRDLLARGIAADKITVIPNSIDPGEFTMLPARDVALARQLGLDGCLVLGFIGSFYGYEGLEFLVEALPAILARLPRARLLLVGGGRQDQALRDRVRGLGLHDRVVFTGRVPHDTVTRYYSIADMLVFPRLAMRLTDLVTPLKPLEAMAQGCLVVASDVGGHRELIEHGRTGWLFRASDAAALVACLEHVTQDEASWAEVRAGGRAYVEHERSWPETVARYAPVYERLLGASPQ
jgi:PEP-CTERM/exosortase A-associated glycosyltransferase